MKLIGETSTFKAGPNTNSVRYALFAVVWWIQLECNANILVADA